MTQTGLLGIDPKMMQIDDEVYVLLGDRVTVVLRPALDYSILVGDTYLHDPKIVWKITTGGFKYQKTNA